MLELHEICAPYRRLRGELPADGVEGVRDAEELEALEFDRDFGGVFATGELGF